MPAQAASESSAGPRSFADLHTHSAASFDSRADVRSMLAKAQRLGLTHLAITDHERIDGALAATELAPAGLQLAGDRYAVRRQSVIHALQGVIAWLDARPAQV